MANIGSADDGGDKEHGQDGVTQIELEFNSLNKESNRQETNQTNPFHLSTGKDLCDKKILIADEMAINLVAIKTIFETLGIHNDCVCATDG